MPGAFLVVFLAGAAAPRQWMKDIYWDISLRLGDLERAETYGTIGLTKPGRREAGAKPAAKVQQRAVFICICALYMRQPHTRRVVRRGGNGRRAGGSTCTRGGRAFRASGLAPMRIIPNETT